MSEAIREAARAWAKQATPLTEDELSRLRMLFRPPVAGRAA